MSVHTEVDRFLKSELGVHALTKAFDLGLVDRLQQPEPLSIPDVAAALGIAPFGAEFLLGQLLGDGVLRRDGMLIRLSDAFARTLAWRDLLQAKLDFIGLVLADLPASFGAFLQGPAAFIERSAVFELFRYDRAFEATEENLAATRRWVGYTTALTRYEADACVGHPLFAGAASLLDIGGNSGEFALGACRRHPGLEATVFDLPVVCRIGEEHVAASAERGRIRFVAGDMRTDPLPSGRDLVTFKSVLHDWPDDEALRLLSRAARQLKPGGSLLVFERTRLAFSGEALPFAMIAQLPFLSFLRPADFYVAALRDLGFLDVAAESVDLDMPFHIVSGHKPG